MILVENVEWLHHMMEFSFDANKTILWFILISYTGNALSIDIFLIVEIHKYIVVFRIFLLKLDCG